MCLKAIESATTEAEARKKTIPTFFQGYEICKFTSINVNNIGRSKFKSLKQPINENGVTSRSHDISGRKSNRGHSFEAGKGLITF